MVSLDKAVVARYSKGEHRFEILVDPDLVQDALAGKVQVANILASSSVFKDEKKGEVASGKDLKQIFGTDEMEKVALIILKEGKIQLTTEQRREREDQLKRRITDYIVRNSMDPTTRAPHPPARIESALKEAKYHPNIFRPFDQQVKYAIDAIRPILPLSTEEVRLVVKIPPEYTGRVYGKLREIGKLLKERWEQDGTLVCTISLPAGMQDEFMKRIGEEAKGEAEINFV
jgi:ribosome maturation protein SDO1